MNAAGDHLQVSPASLLTDPLRAAIREHKAGLLALVTVCPQPLEITPETPLTTECSAGCEAFEERAAIMEFDGGLPRAEAELAARDCLGCRNLTRVKTCREPIRAGLIGPAAGWGIAWPVPVHAATCPAWTDRRAAA